MREVCPAAGASSGVPSGESVVYQTDFPPEEFKARWEKVFERVGERAVAVLEGVPQTNGFIMPAPGQTISRQAPVPVIIQE
jgi:hypothetical protein